MKRLLLPLSCGFLLACGGGGDGGGGGGGGGGATASGTTRFAQWEDLGIVNSLHVISTNSGIYGIKRGGSGLPDTIVKYQITPGSTGWIESSVPTSSTVFTPGETVNDGAGINVDWAGFRSSDVKSIYKYLNAPQLDDIGINVFVAGNGSSGRPWAITRNGDVWRKSSGGGSGTNASVTYDLINKTGINYLGDSAAVSDGNGTLYAGGGNQVARVTSSKSLTTWTMPSFINTLVYAANTLWIGAGGEVYKLEGNSIIHYATLSGLLVNISTEPTFCISRNNMYTSGGMVYRSIDSSSAAPTPESYLSTTSQVDTSSMTARLVTGNAFGPAGVYCSDNTNRYVFTFVANSSGTGLSLIKIIPL